MAKSPDFFHLDPSHTDPARVRREREKARELRKSRWWRQKLADGSCHYCGGKFKPTELTMDHVVPIARGGESSKGNIVPACRKCNEDKKLATPADRILERIRSENDGRD